MNAADRFQPFSSMMLGIKGVEDGQLIFEFFCRDCGGYTIDVRKRGGVERAHCAACGTSFASMARLRLEMLSRARRAGYDVTTELEKLIAEQRKLDDQRNASRR